MWGDANDDNSFDDYMGFYDHWLNHYHSYGSQPSDWEPESVGGGFAGGYFYISRDVVGGRYIFFFNFYFNKKKFSNFVWAWKNI